MKKALKKFKKTDALGEKIRLTYKGEMTYKTYVGAFFTMFQRVAITIYIIYELYLLFMIAHPVESTTYRLNDYDAYQPIMIKDYDFQIALGFNETLDESYGTVKAYQVKYFTN